MGVLTLDYISLFSVVIGKCTVHLVTFVRLCVWHVFIKELLTYTDEYNGWLRAVIVSINVYVYVIKRQRSSVTWTYTCLITTLRCTAWLPV